MRCRDLSVRELLRWNGQPPVPSMIIDNLDGLERDVESLEALSTSEATDVLARLAGVFRVLKQTGKEIRMLEKLCVLAETDLASKGPSATSEDVRATGVDFVLLGTTYKTEGRLNDARTGLVKGRELLAKIGWDVEVENLLGGQEATMGPAQEVRSGQARMHWTPATGKWTGRGPAYRAS